MKRECLRDLGQMFHDCYKSDEVKFVYGTESKDLSKEIERISELIEYVKGKKDNAEQALQLHHTKME